MWPICSQAWVTGCSTQHQIGSQHELDHEQMGHPARGPYELVQLSSIHTRARRSNHTLYSHVLPRQGTLLLRSAGRLPTSTTGLRRPAARPRTSTTITTAGTGCRPDRRPRISDTGPEPTREVHTTHTHQHTYTLFSSVIQRVVAPTLHSFYVHSDMIR